MTPEDRIKALTVQLERGLRLLHAQGRTAYANEDDWVWIEIWHAVLVKIKTPEERRTPRAEDDRFWFDEAKKAHAEVARLKKAMTP